MSSPARRGGEIVGIQEAAEIFGVSEDVLYSWRHLGYFDEHQAMLEMPGTRGRPVIRFVRAALLKMREKWTCKSVSSHSPTSRPQRNTRGGRAGRF